MLDLIASQEEEGGGKGNHARRQARRSETPRKQAGLCADESSVSSGIYTISSGGLPQAENTDCAGNRDRDLVCFAGRRGVQGSLEVGNFLFGVGDCLLLGVNLVLLVLQCRSACFVG